MAATNAPVGPVAFKDSCGAMPLPRNLGRRGSMHCYQGTWVTEDDVPGIIAIQQTFVPRRGDVVLVSQPKCGTTWLKALAFATMARGVYPPAGTDHPLLRHNPHDCVPFMEMLFAAGRGSEMDALPSPRLMATHLQHSVLPDSITNNPDCKIVYICREPKDMLVSLFYFARRFVPDISFSDLFEAACYGISISGPIWDNVLGYWNASKASPETVLFLRYEDMLGDPKGHVKKLAQFVGQPFSAAEEEAGVVTDVVRLCSFDTLRNLEINKPAAASTTSNFANDWYFRKAEIGDWANHMTPDMARRFDEIIQDKLSGSGLSFEWATHGLEIIIRR